MLIRLKIALLRAGVSQQELARTVGVTPAYLSRMICGHVKIRTRYQRRIAKYLDIPQSKLFPGSTDTSAQVGTGSRKKGRSVHDRAGLRLSPNGRAKQKDGGLGRELP